MPNSNEPIQRASSTCEASADQRIADAHEKDFAGDELRQPAVAFVGEYCLDARDRAGKR